MLQSAVNVSEGRDERLLALLERAGGPTMVDRHSDGAHHRSVFTFVGDAADVLSGVCALSEVASSQLNLVDHVGVHPRFGVIDVVPFIPFLPERQPGDLVDFTEAEEAADAFTVVATELDLTVARYGNGRSTLPDLRRALRQDQASGINLARDTKKGIVAVGVRDVLIAWNLWIEGTDIESLRAVAAALRSAQLRTLALTLDGSGPTSLQLSCNIVAPFQLDLNEIAERAADLLPQGASIHRAELVGLVPWWTLHQTPPGRWNALNLNEASSLEWRLAHGRPLPT